MNICVTIKSLVDGGAEKQSIFLASALQAIHNTHLVIVSTEEKTQKHLDTIQAAGLSHLFLEGNLLQKYQQFRAFLIQQDIELVFSYLPGDIMFSALAKMNGIVPYVIGGIRNSRPEIALHKLVVLRFLHNNILNYSISNSYSGATDCIQFGFNKDTLLVFPNGVNCPSMPLMRPQRESVKIISIGRFVPQKDYETALKAIALLRQKTSLPFRYQIVGYGDLETSIRQWIAAYGLQEVVDLFIQPPNVQKLLQEADIYFCSSTFGEGLSNAIMEAMAQTLPLVATDVGDNGVLVTPKVNGYLAPHGAAERLAEGLATLINDPQQRLEFGRKSYQYVQEKLSRDRFLKNYTDLIQSLKPLPVVAGTLAGADTVD